MINKISFGSTYKINLKNNSWEKLSDAQSLYFSMYDLDRNTILHSDIRRNQEHLTIVANDVFDNSIEGFLAAKNIKFQKYTKDELMSEQGIKERMVVPNMKYPKDRYLPYLININTEKFDKAFRETGEYYLSYDDCIKHPERYESFKEYIKSAEPIQAPEVFIREKCDEPYIYFQDGTHRYAYMRNSGFKTIPVAMDAESFVLARKYKLI